MYRFIHALLLGSGLSISAMCLAQESLIGTYRLVSFTQELDGSPPQETMGKSPRGYTIFTATRWMNIFGSEDRKFGTTAEDKAGLYDSLVAYSGLYRVDGSKLIVSVDTSWNERWNGTQVARNGQLEGRRLTITTDRLPSARDPSKMSVSRAVLEKVE